MDFGPGHYMRDWELLACICKEWTEIRKRFGLGSKATRQQIEAYWDEIFNAEKTAWPCIRRLYSEMLQDSQLLRALKAYWGAMARWEQDGYEFAEILSGVLNRLCWMVIRGSCKWLEHRGATEHWGRFWATARDRRRPTLLEELVRAIEDLRRSEAGVESPQQTASPLDRQAPPPEERLEALEEICQGHPEQDAAVFKDWWITSQEFTEEEEDRIARRHQITRDELNAIIRRLSRRLN